MTSWSAPLLLLEANGFDGFCPFSVICLKCFFWRKIQFKIFSLNLEISFKKLPLNSWILSTMRTRDAAIELSICKPEYLQGRTPGLNKLAGPLEALAMVDSLLSRGLRILEAKLAWAIRYLASLCNKLCLKLWKEDGHILISLTWHSLRLARAYSFVSREYS